MYKKLLSFIIILITAAFMFSGCQQGDGKEENTDRNLKERLLSRTKTQKSGGLNHQSHLPEHLMLLSFCWMIPALVI